MGRDLHLCVIPPWYRTWWMYSIYVLVLGSGFWVLIKWRERKLKREKEILEEKVRIRTEQVVKQKKEIEFKNAELQQANEEITSQRDEITTQRDLLIHQKEEIRAMHNDLTDSINYAKRIQAAILPDVAGLTEYFTEHFILFKPRNIVSGDFYWYIKIENQIIFTVADCTGHGVPGAFMSMLGISFLREIVQKEYKTEPAVILRNLRKEIINALKQKGAESIQKDMPSLASAVNDGMDISLCTINADTLQLQWAGANNPLYLLKNVSHFLNAKHFEEIKGDKMPIGIYERMDKFILHEITLNKGDIIYLSSDGYHDQFGGPRGKKFTSKRFKELLLTISDKPLEEQKEILNNTIENWCNPHICDTVNKAHLKAATPLSGETGYNVKYDQTDDITVMGIKI
ncbi:MAG: SpoIIE family protein phosphatase [Bacteroidia bacterium]|nr:SpoIIE family protein phosphatase [Bacteroidia bacterium]